jgi:hypothetical protein
MRKYLISGVILPILLLMLSTVGEGEDRSFQQRVWEAIEALKSRPPAPKEEFIDIDPKRVRFPHKKHQDLLKELDESCEVCHHKRKKGRDPRACRRCHFDRKRASRGKYARIGQKLKYKDIFHLLCGDCHKKMLRDGYRRSDGSPAMIPSKCHHCHLRKDK